MTKQTTQALIERLRVHKDLSLCHEAADALEAKALDLDVQAGSIEAVQAANQRLSEKVEAQAREIERLDAWFSELADNRNTLRAELAAIRAVPVVNAGLVELPKEDTEEANKAITSMLAEYQYPANPQNAGRAGWRAARLYTARTQQAQKGGE